MTTHTIQSATGNSAPETSRLWSYFSRLVMLPPALIMGIISFRACF
jgi:hypothetical protein